MTDKTHNLIGTAALVTLATYVVPKDIPLYVIICYLVANAVGSSFPDLDQATNKLWDLLPGGNFIGKLFRNIFMGHRNITHSLLGGYLVFVFTWWIIPRVFNIENVNQTFLGWSFLVGYYFHLAADGITEEGLPLLWPLKIKFGIPPVRSWRIKTGKWFENLIIFPGTIAYLAWLIYTHWSRFQGLIRI